MLYIINMQRVQVAVQLVPYFQSVHGLASLVFLYVYLPIIHSLVAFSQAKQCWVWHLGTLTYWETFKVVILFFCCHLQYYFI